MPGQPFDTRATAAVEATAIAAALQQKLEKEQSMRKVGMR